MKSIIVCLLGIILLGCSANEPVRVLLITGGHDFDKPLFYAMLKSFPGVSYEEVKHPDALAMFRPENRKSYDVVLLYDMPKAISEQEKVDFINTIEEGKGMVVLHHAYCSYQDWPEYKTIIGGRYYQKAWTDDNGNEYLASTYKHDVRFKINVAGKKHPVTKGIGDFEILDETYGNGSVNDGVHVLLTTNEPTSTSSVAWANRYGKSDIVTILLGHDNNAWTNPNFTQLLLQAIQWVK